MSLSGKVALITGGAKNLGAQIARELAASGADLALHYNSSQTKSEADALVASLKKSSPKIKIKLYQGDLTTEAHVKELFANVLADFHHLDIVMNTVGKVLKRPLTEITEQEIDSMLAINSKAAFLILQEGARHVRDGGKLITMVSALLGAYTGGYTSYAGSKAPVEHFTRGASKELASRRISVNCIAAGPMDTPFFYGQEDAKAVEYCKSQGMGNRLTDVTDIAPLIRFLCTEGHWITGQTIFDNGGFSTR